MSVQIVDKLLFLVILVVIARYLYLMFPFRQVKVEANAALVQAVGVVEPVALPEPVIVPESPHEEIVASPLFVCQFGKTATLLVRFRHRKRACTAHLIIWAGAKKRRYEDSYYDLGIIEAEELTHEVIETALALATRQLEELAEKGKQKREELAEKRKQKCLVGKSEAEAQVATMKASEVAAEEAVEVPFVEVAQPLEVPPVVMEEESETAVIKLKKFPSVFRGVIQEIGMMPQHKDGRDFETFGVRYRTQEGVVDAVYGMNLRVALREANVGVGDEVEIVKIGRKTITQGKAPMNLFKIAKLSHAGSNA